MGMGGFIGKVNTEANHLNPFKGLTDWSTNHSLAYIPGVGKPLAQAANWGDSHPSQVGAAIGAMFGGAALLGGAGAGAAGAGGAGAEAGGLGAGAAGAGYGGLGTASGFGGVGTDAAATGFGSWGTAAGGADVGGLAAADSAAVGAEGAEPGLTSSYGPASSSFDWQGLMRRGLGNMMQNKGGGSSSDTLYQQPGQQTENADQVAANRQRLALALANLKNLQPANNTAGQYSWTQGANQLSQAALAAYLMGRNR